MRFFSPFSVFSPFSFSFSFPKIPSPPFPFSSIENSNILPFPTFFRRFSSFPWLKKKGLSEVVLREAWRTSPQSTWGGGGPGARGSALGSVRGVLLDEALELCIRGKGGGQGDNGGKGGFRASAIKEHSSLLR